MKNIVKTKIVCTIGPSTWDPEVLKKLIDLGMKVARINASFADYNEIKRVSELVRSLSDDVAILLDLKGHKIRLSDFSQPIEIKEGEKLIIDSQPNEEHIFVSYSNLHNDIKEGAKILIDDGKIKLIVEKIEGTKIYTVAQNSGIIKRLKTVNVPGTYLSFDPLTEKDKNDIQAGIECNVDFIAGSFIRDINDVNAIKERIKGTNIKIIAKIEDPLGVKNFDEILKNVYGIMIARGDLGVEIEPEEVPILQKQFIKKCKILAKPVIVATHMLESMIQNPAPTRSEVSDVANAIFDRTDAIMTSAETSTGKYPIESIDIMHKVCKKVEEYITVNKEIINEDIETLTISNNKKELDHVSRALAISRSAIQAIESLRIESIIVITKEGLTARLLSRYDPPIPIYAFTPNSHVRRHLLLSKGIYPYYIENIPNGRDETIKFVINKAKSLKLINSGSLIGILIGSNLFNDINSSVLELFRVP